jgi:hypothetical protein
MLMVAISGVASVDLKQREWLLSFLSSYAKQ